jgi:hypothetical protein
MSNKRVVDAAVPKPDRYIICDEEIKGFGLLVMPSGSRATSINTELLKRDSVARQSESTANGRRQKPARRLRIIVSFCP